MTPNRCVLPKLLWDCSEGAVFLVQYVQRAPGCGPTCTVAEIGPEVAWLGRPICSIMVAATVSVGAEPATKFVFQ